MKSSRYIFAMLLVFPFFSYGQSKRNSSEKEQPTYSVQIPHLENQGTATQLVVEGNPFLMIAGELHNSTCGGFEYMRPVWKKLAQKNLNSVIASVSWELIEPVEGKFDFSLLDSIIEGARAANLKLGLIWFASWKNGGSTYIPSWVKKNYMKYPRVKDEQGKSLEILSTFGRASCEADAKAFSAMMHHIKEVDSQQQTVILVQVENEVGLLDNLAKNPGIARRDFCTLANKAYNSLVPNELINYLVENRDKLYPELNKVWAANGYKTSGTWEEVFGKGNYTPDKNDYWHSYSFYTEELFMAWNYARYVEEVVEAGKKEYGLPMYVNAWLRYTDGYVPGKFPSGGPLPEVLDVWRAAAPSIDFYAPDIYSEEFAWVCQEYSKNGNPLFIPETRPGKLGAARAFYAFGECNAGCFSPFGIDDYLNSKDELDESYSVLNKMSSIILENQGKATMRGILVDSTNQDQKFKLGNYHVEARLTWGNSKVGGGLIIQTGDDEFIVAGSGIDIFFLPNDSTMRIGVNADDAGTFVNGKWKSERRLNGDEVHSSTWVGTGAHLPGNEVCIQKISLYQYH